MLKRLGLVSALAVAAMIGGPALAATNGDSTAYHLYPTAAIRASMPNPLFRLAPGKPPLQYYGGPVLAKVRLVSVIWGANVSKATINGIGPYLKELANSTFIDQLAQYSTNITGVNLHAGTNQTIGRGSYVGQFKITPKNLSPSLTDAAIQAELKAQIAAGKLPAADPNTLYMIYFPFNVTITSFGKSCVAFAAYHSSSSATVAPSNLFYGVMPDCGGGFAEMTITSSHEIAEAMTDAIPTPGSNPVYPQAWNTSNGYEVGDLCEGTRGVLTGGARNYAVQEVFLNTTKACGKGNFRSP